MKKLLIVLSMTAVVWGCGTGAGTDESASPGVKPGESPAASSGNSEGNPSYDPKRGHGKFNAENVKIGAQLDQAMATNGEKIYGVKCSGCHKLTDEKLVGPGWMGVTSRHEGPWIMNFMTNVDEMLDKDPKAKAMLEICLVRMPNQNLGDDEARSLLEFMRKNDGVK